VTDAQNKETEQVDFLLTKDYHPNTKGAVDLGLTTPSGISGIVSAVKQGSIDLVILLKESIPEGIDPTQVICLDTNLTDAAKNASLAAPIQIFCEAEGSFTNKNGLKQTFEKSMNPIQGLQTSAGVVELIVKTMTKKMEASVGNR
jgi:NADH-quinone oxidoreductase subunit G